MAIVNVAQCGIASAAGTASESARIFFVDRVFAEEPFQEQATFGLTAAVILAFELSFSCLENHRQSLLENIESVGWERRGFKQEVHTRPLSRQSLTLRIMRACSSAPSGKGPPISGTLAKPPCLGGRSWVATIEYRCPFLGMRRACWRRSARATTSCWPWRGAHVQCHTRMTDDNSSLSLSVE